MDLIYKLLKLNRVVASPRLKLLAIIGARVLKLRHLSLRIDTVTTCNLKCLMCPVPQEPNGPIQRFSMEDRKRLGRMLFNKALQVVIGCSYEPTMDKHFMGMVKMAQAYSVPYVGLTSNGQLLNEQHIELFIRYGLTELTLSVHGLHADSYQRFMVNASYGRLHRFLERLDVLKSQNDAKFPKLRINFTVNADTIDELPLFFDKLGRYDIHTLQIRPMFGDAYPEGRLTHQHNEKYKSYIKSITHQCSKRNITLMAHTENLSFRQSNHAAVIYPDIFYHVNPNLVWRPDFNWQDETYAEFCNRIKYEKYLIKSIFMKNSELLKRANQFPGSGRFDIL